MSIKRILPIFIILFLGYLGFSIVLPLFPPMFLNPKYPFLPFATSAESRRVLLGILFSMYPLGQFLGAPLLGKYSDKYGRKPVMLLSLIVTIPTYIGCALSILFSLPFLLFLFRFICGLFEGNIVIAQAVISDISTDQKAKIKNFGWMISISSSAFIIGPILGGKLADTKLVDWFHYATPFWGAVIFVTIGVILIWFLFKETHTPNQDISIDIDKIFHSFIEGYRIKKLQKIFLSNFVIYLSLFFFFNFFPPFLVNTFHFGPSMLGEINTYLALFVVSTPLFFGKFSKHLLPNKMLLYGSLLFGVGLLLFILPRTPWALLFTLIPLGFLAAVGFAFTAIFISDVASKQYQGQALGTNQSIQVIAEALTALIGGFLMVFLSSLPLIIGAFCAFIGAILLPSSQKSNPH